MYQPQNKPAPRSSAEHNALKVNPIQFSNLPSSSAWELYLKMNTWTRLITKQDVFLASRKVFSPLLFLRICIFYYFFEFFKDFIFSS
jgi:hypothetical protein